MRGCGYTAVPPALRPVKIQIAIIVQCCSGVSTAKVIHE
jgi:hypothetical protein